MPSAVTEYLRNKRRSYSCPMQLQPPKLAMMDKRRQRADSGHDASSSVLKRGFTTLEANTRSGRYLGPSRRNTGSGPLDPSYGRTSADTTSSTRSGSTGSFSSNRVHYIRFNGFGRQPQIRPVLSRTPSPSTDDVSSWAMWSVVEEIDRITQDRCGRQKSNSTSAHSRPESWRLWRLSRIANIQYRLPEIETDVYCAECGVFVESVIRYRIGASAWLLAFIL